MDLVSLIGRGSPSEKVNRRRAAAVFLLAFAVPVARLSAYNEMDR